MPTWPNSGTISTANMSAGGDSPAAARADIKGMADDVEAIKSARDAANGIPSLDGSALLPVDELPVVPVNKGGTGATTAAAALTALGAQAALGFTPASKGGDTLTGALTINTGGSFHEQLNADNDGATGVVIGTAHRSASPAINDEIFQLIMSGGEAGVPSSWFTYAMIAALIDSAVAGSPKGRFVFRVADGYGNISNALELFADPNGILCAKAEAFIVGASGPPSTPLIKLVIIDNVSPQARLGYDAAHYVDIGGDASGNAQITPSGSEIDLNCAKVLVANALQVGTDLVVYYGGISISDPAKCIQMGATTGPRHYGNLAAAPNAGTEIEGDEYYDTTSHKKCVWDGSTWQNCW